MSSDSDHMPKPSKRIRCRISDTSESSSDESVIARIRRKRRNHMKVVSDDDSSEEELSPTGKKNTNKALESDSDSYSSASNYSAGSTSDEWESDWESESDEDMFESPKTKKRSRKDQQPKEDPPKSPENVESDESDGTSEKCPICFLSFRRQQIAVPSCCEHCFCLICLTEWSKNVNTCPVDRKTFTTMKVKENINGSVIKCISVEPKNATEEQVQEDPTFCEICHLSDREDRLLLCDGCDSGYHLECLVPPMDEVPYDNWYCPECSANDPNMAEEVNIETNEVSDLIAEARCLGMTYGRREAGLASQYMSANNFRPLQHRLVPRTRQTERVRASIRATRSRREPMPELVAVSRVFDPDQPSTSSGFDSISENSRGRSPNASSAGNFSQHSRRTASKSKSRSKPTSRKKKTPKRKKAKNNEPVLQKVVIKDYDTDGEEREIVSYVKVKSGTSSRKRKKRSKKTFKRRKNKYHRRACRRIGNIKSVRKRVAIALNMAKKKSTPNPIGLISLTNQSSSVPQGTEQLTNARYRAGIPQLNLFGNNLPLDYCPFGSDDEINPSVSEEDGISGGNMVSVTRRSASSITGLRRRLGLKNRVSRVRHEPHPQPVITDLLDNIISSQELWHSKDTRITLKADGTFSIPEKKNNKPDIVRNNDFLKDSDQQSKNDSIIASVTGSANINSADILQAPMYNNSRGGNNSDGRSFRGNYHNRGHHGHNRNDYGPPRDSYSGNGPPTYGGPGPRDSFGHGDFRQPPPLLDFSPNRRQPHSPGMINRNRNNPNFRNNPRGRNFNNDRGGFRPLENLQNSNFQPPENFHSQNVSNINTGALPSNVSNLSLQDTTPENLTANVDAAVENTSNSESAEVNPANESAVASSDQPEGEECDIYSDIDMSKPSDNPEHDNKGNDGDSSSIEALLPPPIPPSDLLDFEDNLKSDNESDDNDLVIDDTPKEPVKDADGKDCKTDDKYDPFAVIDSDSNDENNPRDVNSKKKSNQGESSLNLDSSVNSSTLPPLEPPPMPPDFSAIVDMSGEMKNIKKDSLTLLGTYYNDEDDDNANQDDDDDETKSDCPNFSIYSSETMDVARHAEQELTQQIGPLEPPPMPPLIPDDDDIIVADVQTCDLADIPEPSDPYIESLQKERQTLSKIPTKKLSIDSRGKITFKIGNKSKLNNKLCNLEDRFEDTVSASMDKDKDVKDKEKNKDLKDKDGKIDESKEKEVKSKDVKEKEDTDDKKKESSDKEDDKKSKEKEGENESKEKESQKFLVKTTDNADDVEKSNEDDDNSAAVVVVVVENKEDKEEEFEVIKIDSPEKEKDKDNIDELISENKNENEEIENAEIVEVQESICLSKSTSNLTEESNELKLRKDNVEGNVETKCTENEVWESDGAYTPCKDEMPVKESIKLDGTSEAAEASFDNGLEPITPPPKDRSTDDLGARCRTPIEYAGLGTEAISETDEPINFEEELTMLSQRKDKEIEDGEVSDENKLSSSGNNKKHKDKSSDTDNNPDSSRKKKKNRRDRNKEASEKNKENISSDNQVEWKKISKSTKERSYREKSKNYESGEKDKSKDKSKYRDKSKDRGKKHGKEDSDKKKVKRKELPRYDVRKIVSEKPVRPRKDEYGRDIRDLSLSLSPSRSLTRNRRSHSRLSRSYSPRMNLRKSRSWSRHRARSRERSQNRSSPYKQSLSHSRRKSPTRDRRSLSRRRSRSPTSRRNQRISPARQHQSRRSKKKSLSRKNRSRTRSWSRSRSRSPRVRSRSRVKSRSRSRLRMRSRSKSRTSSKSPSKTRSRSRGAKKKEKLRKQKSPSASHSRRRKRSRSRSKSPSKKTPKSLRTKRRAKRDSNVSQTNACHSFITRSRSRERSYSHARNWNKISDKDIDHSPFDVRGEKDQQVSGNAGVSWSAQWTPSWSRSRSRTPIAVNKQRDDHMMQSRNWSPTSSSIGDMIAAQSINLPPSSPPSQSSLLASMSNALGNINGANPSAPTQLDNHVSPKNLTVILRNKDATKSKKKKDKRSKDKKKSRDADRRKGASKRNRTPPPSKEVFASGDNILVSVCFNNDNAVGQSNNMMNLTDTLPLLTTTKRRRREPVQEEAAPPAKKPKKDKSKEKKSRPSPKVSKRDKKRKSKAAEIAATKKPVAVIDLDQSPFREQTLSPQDVIVLSDDDNVGNNDGNNLNNGNNGNNVGNEERGNINAMNSSHDNTINTSNNSEHNIISIDNNSSGVNNQNNDGYDDDDDDDDDDRDREDNSLFMFANQQQDGDNQGKGDDKVMQQEHQLKLLQQKRLKLSEHEQFMIQGPKTPPEPQIKFSISKQQSNLRSMIMHPLFNRDRDDELEMVEQLNANASRGKEGQVQNEIFDENDSSEINRLGQDQTADKNMEDEEDLGNEGKKGDGQVVDDDDGEQDDEEGEDEEEDRGDEEEQKGEKDRMDDSKKQDKDKRDDEDKSDKKAKNDAKNSEVIDLCKIGPNTPPEPPNSPLTSPDVYDPFDPTKSRSPTPSIIEEPHLPSEQKHPGKSSDLNTNNEKPESDKPKVISMVTIKRASPEKAAAPTTKPLDIRIENKSLDHLNQNSGGNLSCFTTINPVLATVAAAVQRSGIFNNPGNYSITQRNINRLSPSSQLKQRGNERPQLTNLFTGKNLGANSRLNKAMENRNSSMLTNNGGDLEGNDATIDTSSPYSPGSSLSDGIFDPPSPAKNHSPQRSQLPSLSNLSNINKNSGNNVAKSKKDLFDSLFDSSPVVKMNSKLRNLNKKSSDKRKKSGNSKIGVRMDENQLQILDDLPSSAVEMQVKDKFLKKLNRQERVVEEVKLVLKPHYTKKHITKEEYKDIMRKAVPKICHNKSGEINPKKIAQLVEAYVKRCRSSKRKLLPEAKPSATTTAATNKNLRLSKTSWS